MAQDNLNKEFTFRMTDAQAKALIVYSYWKGLSGCDEALRLMIDAASSYMTSKGVDMAEYAAAIDAHLAKKTRSPTQTG
jgi:hypothetical protein